MRQRPIEFWWISAFAVFQVVLAFSGLEPLRYADQRIVIGYALSFLGAALLLMWFSLLGRLGALVLLSVETCHQLAVLAGGSAPLGERLATALISIAFCLWMICYLRSASTERLCQGAQNTALPKGRWLDLLELALGAGAGFVAARLGADLRLAGCVGLAGYILYGLLLEDWLRYRWRTLAARIEPGFPRDDAARWRAACSALARQDLFAARREFAAASAESRAHPAGALFLRVLAWQEELDRSPADGAGCLRRAVYDHDWKPSVLDRNSLAEYLESAREEEVRALLRERAELISGLVRAGLQRSLPFAESADRYLARITGESFQFNTAASWAAWWEQAETDWSGDVGAVSLVVRLTRFGADTAAHALARCVAGRAEEPQLKEFTAQVVFLNAMQKAMRGQNAGELTSWFVPFLKQPHRMLLVPELCDAIGLLHADWQLLEELGMPPASVARRLQQRVPLVDYIARLWQRYPHELGDDLPWVLKTLTQKNFGLLRARSRFQSWWPRARETCARQDRAFALGLTAYAEGDCVKAEEAFRTALAAQPRSLSARYNLALCLIRREEHTEAARLLKELTKLEPKESYWWLVLGEMHRTVKCSAEAHAAFRRALELGAAAPQVALQRALTFGHDNCHAEAIRQLDRVLGANPTAAKIDTLIARLESEGLWKLAGHYRERSFQHGLADEDRDGDQSAEGVL